ncbi:PLP-dependent aminotransferase family protein [Demequina pelophila]|uniref:aminotransferase-like domain-containing protein n=1 Tax=Demequina pelophila TaxID=1638984 RepID=UPI00078030DD|nr:PLP-dependent aminotransferase family protein [Demequina pelophila]
MRSIADQLADALAEQPASAGPLYRQVAAGVESLARVGALEYGVQLPSERDLAERLHVSRNTVKAAYRLLREKGWLEVRPGAAPRLHHPSRGRQHANAHSALWLAEYYREEDHGTDLLCTAPAPAPVVERALRDPEAMVGPIRLHGTGYSPEGHPALLDAVAVRLRADGHAAASPERVVVTSGGQHAHALLVGALVSRSRPIAVEELTFPGIFDAVSRVHAPVIALPMRDGRLDAAAAALVIRAARPALAIVTTFQHPTGARLEPDEAAPLVAAAHDAGTVLVENRCAADLALDGDPPAPLASLSEAGPVATIGSMTKVFWGGLRIGWIHTNLTLAAHLRRRRVALDFGSSPLQQRLAAALLAEHFDATVRWRRETLRASVDAVLDELARAAPRWAAERPAGGPGVWVDLGGLDATRFAARAEAAGLPLAAGELFEAREGAGAGHVRISCQDAPERLRGAIRSLASLG